MIRKYDLTEEQISKTLIHNEFGDDIIRSCKNVAVIMSQGWCPQWMMVSRWLDCLSEEADINIFITVYDRENYYETFMHFKETIFGNRQVPYIRYYIDGALVKETNYTSKDFFLQAFNR